MPDVAERRRGARVRVSARRPFPVSETLAETPPTPILLALVFWALASTSLGCRASEPADDPVGSRSDSHADAHSDHEAGHEADPHSDHELDVVELSSEVAASVGLRVVPVERERLEGRLETTGHVGFDEDRLTHVGPRVPGRLVRVDAALGDSVRAGDTLATIESPELEHALAEYRSALARHDLARQVLARHRSLLDAGVTSEQDVETVRAELEQDVAELRRTEQRLRFFGVDPGSPEPEGGELAARYAVTAPFAGRVVERHATRGELVTPEDTLFTLADLGTLWIWIDLYERDLSRVHEDDEVEVRLDAYPGETFTGRVSYLADRLDPATRTLRARIDLPNPEGRLRAGLFARVVITDPHADSEAGDLGPVESALVVPEAALQRPPGEVGEIVFVALDEHRFERREVRTGRRFSGRVEILEGVRAGESVVVEGAFVLLSELAKDELASGHAH